MNADIRVCALCGHTMTMARCGSASVPQGYLCHTDDHDCYRAWTVYGIRLANVTDRMRVILPAEVRESVMIARERIAFDELVADGPDYFGSGS